MQRAILVHKETNEPVDKNWTPSILPEELENGNKRMALNNLPWRWQWLQEVAA